MACTVVVLAGCGGGASHGQLAWTRSPLVFAPPRLADDRVVVGQVRNTSLRPLRLDVREMVVRDSGGRALASSARFAAAFAHPLYGAFQKPSYDEPFELDRLGVITELRPGETGPLYVAYRLREGSEPPISVEYGPGALELPLAAVTSPHAAR
ncbi:MAG: hypothetical protein ACRDUY_02510 [Nitriliruptorales bacterium]